MAITITNALASDLPAYAPCIVSGTSTRAPISSSGNLESFSISNYNAQSGRLAVTITIGAEALISIGDIVTISGATGDAEIYNGRHKVYSFTSSLLITETLWISEGTITASGTLIRINDGMRIRADIYNDATLINSVYTQPVKNAWEIDVSGALQSQFGSIFSLTERTSSNGKMAFVYNIKFYEQWQQVDYSIYDVETVGAVMTGIAHKTTDLTDQIEGFKLLTSNYQSKFKILHHFLTDKTTNVKVKFTPYEKTVAKIPEIKDILIANKHGFVVYNIPTTSGITKILVETLWFNGTENVVIKDNLEVIVPQETYGTRLYYLNSKGGFQTLECVSWEDIMKVEKIDRYTIKAWTERTHVSILESKTSAAYFKDLINAVEVYDTDGTEVELLTQNAKYYGDNVQIGIVVKYEHNILT